MKKVALVVCIIALICTMTGIPYLIEGITARGWGGVNYGRVVLPLLVSGISFWQYKRHK